MKKDVYNLTNPQKSIWYTEQFYKGTSINNVSGTVMIKEKLNLTFLKKAIMLFVKKNDAIRIHITLDDESIPKQKILDYNDFKMETTSLSNYDELKELSDKITKIPFEILDHDLFRFQLFTLENGFGGFICVLHHIISDAWSSCLLANEILSIYYSLKQGLSIDDSLNISYLDFIRSQESYQSSPKYEKDKTYWENKYSNTLPEVVSFCPESQNDLITCEGKRKEYVLTKKQSDEIAQFCKDTHTSLFNLYLGVCSIYLHKTSGLTTIMAGTPVLNRTNVKEKKSAGMFINTLPFDVTINPNSTFTEFISSLGKEELTLFRHQKYPYIELLRYIRSKFNTNLSLYDFILSYQNSTINYDKTKVNYERMWNFSGYLAEPLNIHLCDMDNGVTSIYYDYQIVKFTDEEIDQLHQRLLCILKQIMGNPSILLKEIDIVTPKEKKEILYEFNHRNVSYPKNKTIVDLLEEQVASTPDRIAVTINDEKITYQELDRKSDILAYYLRQYGVVPNTPVAIRMNNSLELITGILAIIKSGGCYLPINLSYPQERVDFMLSDSKAKFLLTNSQCMNDIKLNIPTLLIDFSNTTIYNTEVEKLAPVNTPEDLLYIIYTSGSTGTPKGAMITHKNVVRLLKNDAFYFDFSEKDVWTMFHSVAFDFSVWEMYGALLYGGKLVLVPEVIAKDPNKFALLLREQKVTVLNQTPTYFYNLLDAELKIPDNKLKLRYIIFGGEALKPNLTRGWKDKYPLTKLINMYGITETTVHVTFKELSNVDLLRPDSNIGIPIPTLKVYLMNSTLNLMPYGVEGEICVAGDGICKGYLNRPDLNTEKFVENPYVPGEIIYRSGDSAILDKDGNLYYKGRIDTQVKIRGFRVELGEIEAKLIEHPSIIKCVVLPKKFNDKDNQLIAYIVCNENISNLDLKNYLSNILPDYMIPSHFVKLDAIPLNNNGKVDHKFLLGIKIKLEKTTPYVAPRNKFEKAFQKILEESLNLEHVGIDDNIIEIGADSLSLMKITIDLLEQNYLVNIQDIYEYKTIRNISAHIKTKKQEKLISPNNIFYKFEDTFKAKSIHMKHVLLTGATGFLGAHLLYDLIKNTNAKVYCLIRDKNNIDAKTRLVNKLHYYFGKELLNEFDSRIFLIKGNIIDDNLNLSKESYEKLGAKIDTVIHSAARVNHYGNKELFYKINVGGTNNIIRFCKEFDIRLNYISTISVSGNYVATANQPVFFNERCLYIGQNYNDNIYIKTKFEAEYNLCNEMNNGLKAAIYRLGNITARLSDGKFQENATQNAFLNRILTFVKLQKMPESFSHLSIDFSPVDICSNFIVSIMLKESSYGKVFHIYNDKNVAISKLLLDLEQLGHPIDIVPDDTFHLFLKTIHEKSDLLGIINDLTSNLLGTDSNIVITSDFTLTYLENLNKNWPKINKSYIQKFFKKYLNGDE